MKVVFYIFFFVLMAGIAEATWNENSYVDPLSSINTTYWGVSNSSGTTLGINGSQLSITEIAVVNTAYLYSMQNYTEYNLSIDMTGDSILSGNMGISIVSGNYTLKPDTSSKISEKLQVSLTYSASQNQTQLSSTSINGTITFWNETSGSWQTSQTGYPGTGKVRFVVNKTLWDIHFEVYNSTHRIMNTTTNSIIYINDFGFNSTVVLGDMSNNTIRGNISFRNYSITYWKHYTRADSPAMPDGLTGVMFEQTLGGNPPRTRQQELDIFNATDPDILFRYRWIWTPSPRNCSELATFNATLYSMCITASFDYANLTDSIISVKNVFPNEIFVASFTSGRVARWGYNAETLELYNDTWGWALNASDYGYNMSKNETQCILGKSSTWIEDSFNCAFYNQSNQSGYFPDMANRTGFYKIALSQSKAMIDSGANAIWFDMLFTQGTRALGVTGTDSEISRMSVLSEQNLLMETRDYAAKSGKIVYLGTWGRSSADFHNSTYTPSADINFATYTILAEDIRNVTINTTHWNNSIAEVENSIGDIPILAVIDYSYTNAAPLAVFAQELTSTEQKDFLKIAYSYFGSVNITFVLPLHGGSSGTGTQSYGKYTIYDSPAPEFSTYDTIACLLTGDRCGSLVSVTCPIGWCYLAMNRSNQTLLEIDNVFSSDTVQGYYNSTSQKYESHMHLYPPFQDSNVTQKLGYYFYTGSETRVSVNMTTIPFITLRPGWNLVGNLQGTRNLSTLCSSIGVEATQARYYNKYTRRWVSSGSQDVPAGEAFMVYVASAKVWGD